MSNNKNRKIILLINFIGSILLIIGITAAFLGPAEIYCFYFFTKGGRFYYEGFGFGSFMFGNIALQILGYYIIAVLFIPLGYGHLKKQSWARIITPTLLWVWLIVGIPLILILLFMIVTIKEPSTLIIVLSAIFLILSYILIPILLIKFYRSPSVELTFKAHSKKQYLVEKYPIPLLVITSMYLFYILAFHMFLLYKGIFPFFGIWLIDFKGFLIIDILILLLVVLIWGTLKRKMWTWWVSLFYFCFLTLSSLITLAFSNFSEIITILNFPELEAKALINIPINGFHLSLSFGIPLLITLVVIISSKRYFLIGRLK